MQRLNALPMAVWDPSWYTGFLPQFKEIHVRLTGNSKIPVGVNVTPR